MEAPRIRAVIPPQKKNQNKNLQHSGGTSQQENRVRPPTDFLTRKSNRGAQPFATVVAGRMLQSRAMNSFKCCSNCEVHTIDAN